MASRKNFLGFADGLVNHFIGRNNDVDGFWGVGVLSKAVHERGRSDASFDLLGTPDALDGGSADWLRHMGAATGTPKRWIAAATLRVTFIPDAEDDESWRAWGTTIPGVAVYRVVATATLTDDHGRVREASATTWCRDHDPRHETSSGRTRR